MWPRTLKYVWALRGLSSWLIRYIILHTHLWPRTLKYVWALLGISSYTVWIWSFAQAETKSSTAQLTSSPTTSSSSQEDNDETEDEEGGQAYEEDVEAAYAGSNEVLEDLGRMSNTNPRHSWYEISCVIACLFARNTVFMQISIVDWEAIT
jgi:hypothetical protein